VCNKRAERCKRDASVGAARDATSPRKCVRRLAQSTGVSDSTAWEIRRDDLPLFPYGVQLSQPLSEDELTRAARSFAK
jgi:hypothetical protein